MREGGRLPEKKGHIIRHGFPMRKTGDSMFHVAVPTLRTYTGTLMGNQPRSTMNNA